MIIFEAEALVFENFAKIDKQMVFSAHISCEFLLASRTKLWSKSEH